MQRVNSKISKIDQQASRKIWSPFFARKAPENLPVQNFDSKKG
jgi:hypothetical protein